MHETVSVLRQAGQGKVSTSLLIARPQLPRSLNLILSVVSHSISRLSTQLDFGHLLYFSKTENLFFPSHLTSTPTTSPAAQLPTRSTAMATLSPSDLAAIAASSLALPAALIKTEDEECRVQPESISTASQHASLQTTPGPPPCEASEASENSNISPSPHVLQPTKADSDRFAEDLLRSFQDASVPSPSTPDTVKTRAEEPVAKKDSAHQINFQALMIAISSESSTDMLSPPSFRAPTMSPISDFPTDQSADDGSKPRDNVMATTPSLSQQSTANSKSLSLSSEEFQVRLLQSKVEEATRAEQTLQEKAGSIWREKQEHDNASAGLNRDLECIKTDIKGLHAERRQIEAAVRRKKDRLNEITYEKQRIDTKAQAKWEEGKAVKRDVDEAARSRRSLEKELKEAKVQEELFNMYPDAGLRKFAEHALKNEEHSKLFSAFVQGQARDDDLDAIENLLEEAEDGTKNDIKVEAQPLRSECGGTGAISDTNIFGQRVLT